ncbi:MAG TPA: 2-dehydropantoate 2-reductase [Blastocatellia bacterium]|nr:2-dehydropantoate 2-reductase [Blastocatellia bacterium]
MANDLRYIIIGAGAIGSAVGGALLDAGARVAFVARSAQADALRGGIVVRQQGRELTVKADAFTDIRQIEPGSGDVIFIVTKSQATLAAVEDLAAVYPRTAPVVCLQNGISNEARAAERFERIYAGLVVMSAVQLDPHLITLPMGDEIAVGRYPSGVDDLTRRMAGDLNRSGFKCIASEYVMEMKWGKLVANLNNATHAITGYWLELGYADKDMRLLMREVREEGLRVLDAAGIEVEPPPGEPSPLRIREATRALDRPPRPRDEALKLPEERRTYASMWQDLYHDRKSSEADFLNGEIVRLGRELSIPTPYNSTLLEIINRMFEKGLKPGIYTPSELRERIRSQKPESRSQNPEARSQEPEGPEGRNLTALGDGQQ